MSIIHFAWFKVKGKPFMSKNIENRLLKLHLQDNMIWNANRLLHTGDWGKPRGRLGLFPKHPHGKKTATVGIAMRPELNCTHHRRRKEGKGENPRATKKEIGVDEVKGGWKK